ncbi:MAG: M3 family oligoendopeptidase [Spirochaetales bacterium]|nr:M3 family oligoendopeptidase [Spirochaetales bacterium]
MNKETLPNWDLSMYPGFQSDEYRKHKKEMEELLRSMTAALDNTELWEKDFSSALENLIPTLNRAHDLYETLESYSYCSYSTNTADPEALKALNSLEEASLPFQGVLVRLKNRLAASGTDSGDWEKSGVLKDYIYYLQEALADQKFQLAPEMEDLAYDLARSGSSAWSRLHSQLSSSLKTEWTEGADKTVTELRGLGSDPDRDVRRQAWKKELDCWKSVETSMAAALNGVKGFTHTLNSRRGYKSTLERSVRQAGMSMTTLEAMISSMTESLPDFRRYMKAKASFMGLEKLSWYDTVAPLPGQSEPWSWEKARQFIIRHFGSLSPEYAAFGKMCFDRKWIDAPPREGKVGGAYCIGFPEIRESRVLTNFTGSFNDVSTIAHELGHAWHYEVLKETPALHRHYPMTLAETASIFSETLVFQACYAGAGESERLPLLDSTLSDSNQVITDILSRFLFEKELMTRRSSGELSAEDLNTMMLDAQEATYGDALHPEERHPWMWAVKGHYYSMDLAFYNFPYAFGLLFSLGLYSLYREMGPDFEPLYRKVLQLTGKASAEDCAAAAGLDITQEAFWNRSLDVIRTQIKDFTELAEK